MFSSYLVVEEPSLPPGTVLVPSLLLTDLVDALEGSRLEFGLSGDDTVRLSSDVLTALDAWCADESVEAADAVVDG
jgi:hypothetical protein